jgi:succinyl-CoA synthetase alpha subunit
MSILVDGQTRVLVQGLGSAGKFHTAQCREYGTQVVAAVKPGAGGTDWEGVPIFDTVREARASTGADCSLVFVPAPFAADAISEAALEGLPLIVTITEGIPTLDMVRVKGLLKETGARMIGPNCPGIITPGAAKIGIMPGYIHRPGAVGVVSRSGTLTYEAVWQLSERDIGQSTCIGIGGDPPGDEGRRAHRGDRGDRRGAGRRLDCRAHAPKTRRELHRGRHRPARQAHGARGRHHRGRLRQGGRQEARAP